MSAPLRTYAKFCSLFEAEAAAVPGRGGLEASLVLLGRVTSFLDRRELGEAVGREVW
jgi:hypothetical protein